MFAGTETLWISSDRRTKLVFDRGTGRLTTYVDGVPVRFDTATSSAQLVAPSMEHAKYGVAANTTAFTATGAQVAGADDVVLNLTGTLAGAQNLTLPTAANLVAAIPNARVGQSYKLRIINSSGGAFAWTVVTNTGLTLSGTMTIAQNNFREFIVTLTSLTAVSVQSIGHVAHGGV